MSNWPHRPTRRAIISDSRRLAGWSLTAAIAAGCLAVTVLAGCGGTDEDQEEAASGQSSAPPAVSAAKNPHGTTMDLASLDVCRLMPDEVVGQLLGKRVSRGGTRRDYGSYSQGCDYELRQANDSRAGYEYVFIDLLPSDSYGGLDEEIQNRGTMGQHVTGKRVTGVGDAAFAIENQTEQSTTLHVLWRGRLAVEIKANNLGHARELAARLLERLGAGSSSSASAKPTRD